ncbi:hypothetical protein DFAR_1250005 [Desulfarculales bacterium]
MLKRRLPLKLYLDNGPAFRSQHLEEITASLGIALVHASPYVLQGRGKIENYSAPSGPSFSPALRAAIPFGTSMRPWSARSRTSTTSASIWAPDRPPCNASPAKWSASGRPPPTWEATLGKRPRVTWPWTAPFPWPVGYTKPQYL